MPRFLTVQDIEVLREAVNISSAQLIRTREEIITLQKLYVEQELTLKQFNIALANGIEYWKEQRFLTDSELEELGIDPEIKT